MKNSQPIKRTCPICGKSYFGYPALSRKDNQTEICPDCGTRQAMEMLKVPDEEIEQILRTIHKYSKN